MGGMTKPVKISFISQAGIKIRKPTGKMTEPVKISFCKCQLPKKEISA